MADRSLLLVHSPLVGPSSLHRLRDAARAAGYEVALPDLAATVGAEHPHRAYHSAAVNAASALTTPPIVVGHSGAGAFLPSIGGSIDGCPGLVFVDAILPPARGSHRTTDVMDSLLDTQTIDGVLRPWLDWWPADLVEELLPDPDERADLMADLPRVPRSFYDLAVDVPDGWSTGRCAYLRLSQAYDAELEEASERGWSTASLDSNHLGTHTEPERVMHAIVELIVDLGAGRGT